VNLLESLDMLILLQIDEAFTYAEFNVSYLKVLFTLNAD